MRYFTFFLLICFSSLKLQKKIKKENPIKVKGGLGFMPTNLFLLEIMFLAKHHAKNIDLAVTIEIYNIE
jgi:hypothetical protein